MNNTNNIEYDGSSKFISKLEPKRISALKYIEPIWNGKVVLRIHINKHITLWGDGPHNSYAKVGPCRWQILQRPSSPRNGYGIIMTETGLTWGRP